MPNSNKPKFALSFQSAKKSLVKARYDYDEENKVTWAFIARLFDETLSERRN